MGWGRGQSLQKTLHDLHSSLSTGAQETWHFYRSSEGSASKGQVLAGSGEGAGSTSEGKGSSAV